MVEFLQSASGRVRVGSVMLAAAAGFVVVFAIAQSQGWEIPRAVSEAIEGKDYGRAMALLEPAVKRGDPKALTLAGLLCANVLADSCESQRAVALLTPGAEAGDSSVQHALARALLSARPPRAGEARAWLERAAEQGHAMALFELGQAETASGDPQLVQRGAHRLRRSAQLEFAPAQFALAALYEAGRGVDEKPAEAARWYRAAAEQGHLVAQTRLGSLYERGRGLPLDAKAADRWYRAAAGAGYVEAQYNLGLMYMLGEVVKPRYYEGIRWLRKAAEAGYAKAQDALGRAYHQGVGVRQDRKEALRWFRLAGEQGSAVAQTNAGVIYERDFYLRDYGLAAEWYERAAKAGYGPAMIRLGDLYQAGTGVPKSLAMAQSWWAIAAKSKDPKIGAEARQRMRSGMSSSLELGVAVFGLGDRFPTPGELFDAIIAAGIAERTLYPNAARPIDRDLQAAYDEVDRINREGQQRWNELSLEGMMMKP